MPCGDQSTHLNLRVKPDPGPTLLWLQAALTSKISRVILLTWFHCVSQATPARFSWPWGCSAGESAMDPDASSCASCFFKFSLKRILFKGNLSCTSSYSSLKLFLKVLKFSSPHTTPPHQTRPGPGVVARSERPCRRRKFCVRAEGSV